MPNSRSLQIACCVAILGSGIGPAAADDLDFAELTAPEHDYWNRPLNDPFTKLKEDLQAGRLNLDTSSEKAYLLSLLAELKIPVSTQMLVFSTTSLQLRLISPRSPRALYFNEDLYLGYVPGGKIEIVSLDPQIGGIFYIFDIPRGNRPPVVERSSRCMNCHSDDDTRQVPGIVIKSVIPGSRGGSLDSFRRSQTGHQIPWEDRFGGWHVTGKHGIEKHWGNQIGQFSPEGIVTTEIPPGTEFDWSVYPVKSSDILAHLLHEHQAGFVNRAVELQYRTRSYLQEGGGRLQPERREQILEHSQALVRYLLFADETPFPSGGIDGAVELKEAFLATRRMTQEGLSLKDFNLETRMFQFRCSYMIYSSIFQGLPEGLRQQIYRLMVAALDPEKAGPAYDYLPTQEKGAILKILRETIPEFPGSS
tara:strand:+ start:12763 stop:14025 length:1263 start_codon:yes stop_codon:yes gene_type:complete